MVLQKKLTEIFLSIFLSHGAKKIREGDPLVFLKVSGIDKRYP